MGLASMWLHVRSDDGHQGPPIVLPEAVF